MDNVHISCHCHCHLSFHSKTVCFLFFCTKKSLFLYILCRFLSFAEEATIVGMLKTWCRAEQKPKQKRCPGVADKSRNRKTEVMLSTHLCTNQGRDNRDNRLGKRPFIDLLHPWIAHFHHKYSFLAVVFLREGWEEKNKKGYSEPIDGQYIY